MKILKTLSRKDLAFANGGVIIADNNCCESWHFGIWTSCHMEHIACPADGDTTPLSWYTGNCPFA